MRENRTCGSEGGEALRLPYPYERRRPKLKHVLLKVSYAATAVSFIGR